MSLVKCAHCSDQCGHSFLHCGFWGEYLTCWKLIASSVSSQIYVISGWPSTRLAVSRDTVGELIAVGFFYSFGVFGSLEVIPYPQSSSHILFPMILYTVLYIHSSGRPATRFAWMWSQPRKFCLFFCHRWGMPRTLNRSAKKMGA